MKENHMDHFELVSEYAPTGDQPQAIEQLKCYKLVKGFKEGNQCQTLLGVTGSGKTFTMANVIQQLNKPTLIIAHNKTLAAQLYEKRQNGLDNTGWMGGVCDLYSCNGRGNIKKYRLARGRKSIGKG